MSLKHCINSLEGSNNSISQQQPCWEQPTTENTYIYVHSNIKFVGKYLGIQETLIYLPIHNYVLIYSF